MPFSHIDETGSVHMVNVSEKERSLRTAVAYGTIFLKAQTVRLLRKGLLKKGDALSCARIAAIMAAKRTAEIIPLCHTLPLSHVSVDFRVKAASIDIEASATCVGRTGVEMEALTAVSAAALSIYDMCKAEDKGMEIGNIRLVEKRKEPVA